MIVAARAIEGEAEEGGAEGDRAVVDVVDPIFLLDRAAFAFLGVEPVEGGGEDLLVGGAGEQVAGQLPGDKPVPGQVAVEGVDDPVAPGPHLAFAVDLEAVAVGVAGEVEPVGGQAFAVARRGEEAIDRAFVGIRAGIPHEARDFVGSGGQTSQIEGDAAQQGGGVGLGLGRELAFGKAGEHEVVDGVAGDGKRRGGADGRSGRRSQRIGRRWRGRGQRWNCRCGEGDEGPVRVVGSAGVDPALKPLDLRGREPAEFGRGRRHDFVVVRALEPQQQFAFRAAAGDDDRNSVPHPRGSLAGVETQLRLAAGLVGTVAREALVGEDGADVAVEVDRRRGAGGRDEDHEGEAGGRTRPTEPAGGGTKVRQTSGHRG